MIQIKTGAAAILLALSAGCATIMTGGNSQEVVIETKPAGATVLIDGNTSAGVTPLRTRVSRRTGHFVHITLSGYESYDTKLEQGFNWWFVGDVIMLPPIGFIVDLADGAFLSVNPGSMDVPLKPSSQHFERPYGP